MDENQAGFFGKFDLFSSNVYLRMRSTLSVSSAFGGILTMVFLMIVLYLMIIQTVQILLHSNPQIATTTNFEYPPKAIELSQYTNFIFGLQTTINGTVLPLNQSLLNLSVFTVEQQKQGNHVVNQSRLSVHLRKCTPEDFSNLIGPSSFDQYDSLFDEYMLNEALCPDNFTFNISGTQTYTSFKFVSFEISNCLTASSLADNVTCADSDTADFYWDYGQIKLNLYFSNNNIDPMDYNAPKQLFLDNLFWLVSPNFTQTSTIFMDAYTISDHNNFFASSLAANHTLQNLNPANIDDQQGVTTVPIQEYSGLLINIILQRSFNEILTSRVYPDAGDLMGYIGGLAKSILFILALFILSYSYKKYETDVVNQIYDTRPYDPEYIRRTSYARSEGSIELSRRHQSLFSKAGTDPKEKAKAIATCFDLHKEMRAEIEHSPWDYFGNLFKRKTKEEKDFQVNAIKRGTQDLDIIEIVQKLNEVPKLIDLILTEDQKELFEFIPKKLVKAEADEQERNELEIFEDRSISIGNELNQLDLILNEVQNSGDYENYVKLYRAYRKMREDENPDHKEMNKKILRMIGDDRLLSDFREIDSIIEGVDNDAEFELIFNSYLKKDGEFQNLKKKKE